MKLLKRSKSKHKLIPPGTRFGRLVVGSLSGYLKKSSVQYEPVYKCHCDCGRDVLIERVKFKYGNTQSCGCLRQELVYDRFRSTRVDDKITFYRKKIFKDYVKKAKRREHEFSLTFEEFDNLISAPCHYCGRVPYNQFPYTDTSTMLLYNGIDRKNNDRGYTPDNTVTACKECNFLKGRFNYENFLSLTARIYKHSGRLLQ